MSDLINAFLVLIGDNLAFIIVILCLFLIVTSMSLAAIFSKLGHKFWKGLIPVYNVVELLTLLDIPIWMILLLFIPFVNFVGIPVLSIIIGNKLAKECRKTGVIRIGLMVLPLVFLPVLALGHIARDEAFDARKVTVMVKEEFKLDPVAITDAAEVPTAMSLSDLDTLNRTAVVQEIDSSLAKHEMTAEERKAHMNKADKDRPTAQDLTFDYNIIYGNQTNNPVEGIKGPEIKSIDLKPIEIVEPIIPKPIEIVEPIVEVTPIEVEDINTGIVQEETVVESVIKEVEVVVDEPLVPVIHDVVLEEASPIDDSAIGMIPINRRYDKQGTHVQVEEPIAEPAIEEIIEVKKEPIAPAVEDIVPIVDLPVPDLSEFADMNIPIAAAPDFSIPEIAPLPVLEPVEEGIMEMPTIAVPNPGIQYEQMTSMQIVEPDQLPVAVLVKEEPVIEEGAVEERIPFISLPQTIEVETQNFDDINLYGDATAIFNAGKDINEVLRPIPVQEQAQIDKICPKCGVKLKRDSATCFMCGHSF